MAGKTDYKNKFAAEKYDRIGLMVKKGGKSTIQEDAQQHGESLNEYIKGAIREHYKNNTGKDIDL